jgi:hypothetical protein
MGGAGAGGSTTTKFGQVLIQRFSGITENHGMSMSVGFVSGSTGSGPTCTTTTDGGCTVNVCNDTPSSVVVTRASAGTVTITSPGLEGSAVATPDAAGIYAMPIITFPSALAGAEHLQINANGGEVPAFQGELDVPLVLLMSAPVYAKPQLNVEVPLSADLSLVWTRGVKDVVLWVQGYSVVSVQRPGAASLTCQFPSETGSATIKSTLLQLLGVDGRLNLLTIGSKSIVVGDYAVTLAAALPTANASKELLPQLRLK